MSEESRADRLRERRNKSSDQPEKTSELSEPSKQDKPSDTSTQQDSVKDQQKGTYMYLPDYQKRELDRLYSILKAEYEYEFEESFEKNRHFYPLVIQAGLDQLEDIDPSDLQEHLNQLQ